ncbi:MAG: acyltransferase family protein, partial [Clostridia bacterium]|nr:acyltransferase family protein [Clostridia bacterium]
MKIKYLSFLSVLACFAVVVLHANGTFWTFDTSFRWVSANVLESIFYFAVPVFFMISGATLIDYRERYDTKTYFKKRVLKTLIPFLFWSVAYFLFHLFTGAYETEKISVGWFISKLMNSEFCPVFWFFTPLFTCYLCIPIISLIPKENRKKAFEYLIIIGFITISLLPLIFNLLQLKFNFGLRLPLLGEGYLLFILIGYYIQNYPIKRTFRIVIYALGLLGFALHLGGTWALSFNRGDIVRVFKDYINAPAVLYSVAIFTLFKYMPENKVTLPLYNAAQKISSATFGVYLIHIALLSGLELLCSYIISRYQLPVDLNGLG